MKFILLLSLAFSAQAFASQFDEQLFLLKESYSEKAYQIKLLKEAELMSRTGKLKTKSLAAAGSCIDFVYQGSASRAEAAAACSDVTSMECVEFVYRGPSSRVESAEACSGVRDFSCVEFVYRGSASRVEAAMSCGSGGSPGSCK